MIFNTNLSILFAFVYHSQITGTCDIPLWRNYTYIMTETVAPQQCLSLKRDLKDWVFTNCKLTDLPIDPIKDNYVRRNVKGCIFSEVIPTPLRQEIKLVAASIDALNLLDMDPEIVYSPGFVEFIAGNTVLESSCPIAHRYGGHQFGVWANQLGDGRAILLGEYVNRKQQRWELQLKGSGLTPYSRDGDGRAVLRSSIREFLCSEAMYYLGIPTSRAAVLITSDDPVIRDQFYKGIPLTEKAAVVLRLAPSWFRFGSLELLSKNDEFSTLKILTDFIIQEHFPHIREDSKYTQFFNEVAHKTVDLAVLWQSIGFAHGVLNTDNMSILGITIDYGPFGFTETYDPSFVPNSSDGEQRYAFEKQLEVIAWNLENLARALYPLVNEFERRQMMESLNRLNGYASRKLGETFTKKLGLREYFDTDNELLMLLLQIMEETGADFTMTFRQLAELDIENMSDLVSLDGLWSLERLATHSSFEPFVEAYKRRAKQEYGLTDTARRELMLRTNPRYVLRNWMAQRAIEKADEGDFSEVQLLHEILKKPYMWQEAAERRGFADPPPKWSHTLRVSCSS